MKSKVALALLVIFALSFTSCGVSESKVKEIKKEYFEKGRKTGLDEGKKIGAQTATDQARKEGQAIGEEIGFKEGLQKGRLEAFLEVYILGVKQITPKALLMGTCMFIIFFTFRLSWYLFVEKLMRNLSIHWTDFKWSVIQRFGTKRNLEIKKMRWDRILVNVNVQSEVATSEIQNNNKQITIYEEFIENGLPESQQRDANAKIFELKGKNKKLENIISTGEIHKEKLEEIKSGIDMVIYSVENGATVDVDNLKMDFEDIQYDIDSYLKYDVSDLANDMDQDYRFYPKPEEAVS